MGAHLPWYQILKRERKLRGFTQADVARALQCDTKTVSRWEQNKAFPSGYYIQQLINLFQKEDAEQLGLAEKASIKDPFASDELTQSRVSPSTPQKILSPIQNRQHKEDWGEVQRSLPCYGRENELAEVKQWITIEHAHMIVIWGMGGIGKTTFVKQLAEHIKASFDSIIWYSLQNAPSPENILTNFLHFVEEESSLGEIHQSIDANIAELMRLFNKQRCLIILDNVEAILQVSQHDGAYLEGYEGYEKIFHAVGVHAHQSCLLLISREKPKAIPYLEGLYPFVRSFLLPGMKQAEVRQLLKDKHIFGSDEAWTMLIWLYAGNPLALQLIAVPVHELFGGDIGAFLAEEEIMSGDIQSILAQHIQRLSAKERRVIIWLAIERTATSLNTLYENDPQIISKALLFDILNSLRRRALIETTDDHRFTLQPIIMEYITKIFIEEMCTAIVTRQTLSFTNYALIKAPVSDYDRNSQIHFLLTPVIENLQATFGTEGFHQKLKDMLMQLHRDQVQDTGYAAGNILNLLVQSGADLQGLDCSHLTIRQAYLQGVELPQMNFIHTTFAQCVFTDTFTWVLCVAVSPLGDTLAIGTTTGEIRVLDRKDGAVLFTGIGHTDEIRAIAFSPDGRFLASGSEDYTVRLWDTHTGRCQHVLFGHTHLVRALAFCSNANFLVSASEDCTLRLWNSNNGELVRIIEGHTEQVRAVACHPRSYLLASGGDDLQVLLWDGSTGDLITRLSGHTKSVRALAFSPDGTYLASGGEDHVVCIWELPSGKLHLVIKGHKERVRTIAFGLNGLLASASDDGKIYLWNASSGQRVTAMHGHSNRVWSLAFTPDSMQLISASEDDTLRSWEIPSGRCLKVQQGYTDLIKSVAFHPDGHIIASGSEDRSVRLWDKETGQCLKIFQGHANRVRAVAYHPQGHLIASGSEDETIRLWDASTGQCAHVLRGHTHLVRAVDFHPTRELLVSGSHDGTIRIWHALTGQPLRTFHPHAGYIWSTLFHPTEQVVASAGDDMKIRLWDIETGRLIRVLQGHTGRIWSIAFSKQGQFLASCGDDLTIRVWDLQTGYCLRQLTGHTSWVRSVSFSPDETTLASCSHDLTIRLWDRETGVCTKIFTGHKGWIWSVAFDREGKHLVSGSDDSTIKVWDTTRGICIRTCMRKRSYEGMNITGAQGLTESQKAALRFLGAIDVVTG